MNRIVYSMIGPAIDVYEQLSPIISPPLSAFTTIAIIAYSALRRGPARENEVVSQFRRRFDSLDRKKTELRERVKELEEEGKTIQDMEAELAIENATITLESRARLLSEIREGDRLQIEEEERQQIEGEQRPQIVGEQGLRKEEEERQRIEKEQRQQIEREKSQRIEREERQRIEREERQRMEMDREHLEKEKQALAERRREFEESMKEAREEMEKQKLEQATHEETWNIKQEQFQRAQQITKYDGGLFHFAIIGKSGCGKSSLINAFRNMRNNDAGAAKTGTTETTLEIGRYPDPGTEPPRNRMVWFDIPGAGTQRIPVRDYFAMQGLIVFDFIILVIGDRFEEFDALILKKCAEHKVPTFIVRSKADQHIANSMRDCGIGYSEIKNNPQKYEACRNKFISDSRETVSQGLKRQGLPDQLLYVISRDVLQRTYNSALQHPGLPTDPDQELIHEDILSQELLKVAIEQRCDNSERSNTQGSTTDAKDTLGGVCNSDNMVRTEPSDLAGSSDVIHPPEEQVVVCSPAPAALSSTANVPQSPTTAARECKPQAVPISLPNVEKVVYTHAPTNERELFKEIVRNCSNLRNILVGKPRMMSPYVAVLTFYPYAPIPLEIAAFGGVLRVADYEGRRKKRGAEARSRGSSTQKGRAGRAGGGGNSRSGESEVDNWRSRGE